MSSEGDIAALNNLAREYDNLDGVIVGKALYEGKVDLKSIIATLNV